MKQGSMNRVLKVLLSLALVLFCIGIFIYSFVYHSPSYLHLRSSFFRLAMVGIPVLFWKLVLSAASLLGDKFWSVIRISRKRMESFWVHALLTLFTYGILWLIFMGTSETKIQTKIQQDKNYQLITEQLSAVEDIPDDMSSGYATLLEPLSWEAFYSHAGIRITFHHCHFPFMAKQYIRQLCEDYGKDALKDTVSVSSERQCLEWEGNVIDTLTGKVYSSYFYHAIILWKDCKLLVFQIYGSRESIDDILSHLELDSYVF